MPNEVFDQHWLPVVFMILMGIALLLYVCLDGFDLGIGILMRRGNDEEKDQMLATIAPFWDANETWLVLGIGLLLVAFPIAHGIILGELYLPIAIMLIGLILRGVAFDFRVKVHAKYKALWNRLFYTGSLVSSLAQGYMLGMFIMGFDVNLVTFLFSSVIAVCFCAAYCFIGASWLIIKASGDLHKRAIGWARVTMRLTALGIVIISLITPLASSRIYDKWFSMPELILLIPIPLLTAATFLGLEIFFRQFHLVSERYHNVPFIGAIIIMVMSFHGLAYSFYPYIVPEQLTIWEAASSIDSLKIIFIGTVIVLPTIFAYTIFAHRVFSGKISDISYEIEKPPEET